MGGVPAVLVFSAYNLFILRLRHVRRELRVSGAERCAERSWRNESRERLDSGQKALGDFLGVVIGESFDKNRAASLCREPEIARREMAASHGRSDYY